MTVATIDTSSRRRPRDGDFTAMTVIRNVGLIAALFFVNSLGVAGNTVFFVALLVMAAKSSEHTVRALSLLYLVIVGNTALVDTGSILFGAGKFLFLFLVAIRLLYSLSRQGRMPHRIPVLGPLALFCIVALLLAFQGGYFPYISALKLLSFMAGVICIFAAAEVMRRRTHQLDAWFFSIVVFVMLLGLFTWVMGLGFNSKTDFAYFNQLFNGPFYHPQTLGPAAALMVLWLAGFAVLTRYRLRAWALPMIPVFLVFLYMSSSRTSLLAIGLSIMVSLLLLGFLRREAMQLMKRLARRAFLAALALGLTLTLVELMHPGAVVDPVADFLTKRDTAQGEFQAEVLLSSRQSLVDMMLKNIEQDPLTGIGFGTSTRPGFGTGDSIFRAPTEKGVLPIAIVEETGIIGAVFFVIFVLSVFVYLIRSTNVIGMMGFAALLGINLAEMNFFSFGGQGGFFWTWVMACMLMMPATLARTVPVSSSSAPLAGLGERP